MPGKTKCLLNGTLGKGRTVRSAFLLLPCPRAAWQLPSRHLSILYTLFLAAARLRCGRRGRFLRRSRQSGRLRRERERCQGVTGGGGGPGQRRSARHGGDRWRRRRLARERRYLVDEMKKGRSGGGHKDMQRNPSVFLFQDVLSKTQRK